MRADKAALVALNAVFALPYGNFDGYSAFFKLCGACGHYSADVEGAHGQSIAFLSYYRSDKGFVILIVGDFGKRRALVGGCPLCGHFDLVQSFYSVFDCRVVGVDNLFAFFAVCFENSRLHVFFGFLIGDYVGKLEKRRLHNHVGGFGAARLFGDFQSVDCVEFKMLLRNLVFDESGQFFFQLAVAPRAVEQEGASLFGFAEHIVAGNIRGVVAGDELRLVYEIA